jgi:hypothetical protein
MNRMRECMGSWSVQGIGGSSAHAGDLSPMS